MFLNRWSRTKFITAAIIGIANEKTRKKVNMLLLYKPASLHFMPINIKINVKTKETISFNIPAMGILFFINASDAFFIIIIYYINEFVNIKFRYTI